MEGVNRTTATAVVDAVLKRDTDRATAARQAQEIQYQCAASGGDDYELCFTTNPNQHDNIAKLSAELGLPLTCIGQIIKSQDENSLILENSDGVPLSPEQTNELQRSFDHFRD